jgi:alpha-L-fucosidase 2
MRHPRLLFVLLLTLAGPAQAAAPHASIDWPKFLARHDLVWSRLPQSWAEGAPHGNGLVGAMLYSDRKQALVWELGRSDVVDPRTDEGGGRSKPRLPLGRLELETVTPITSGEARLDLWNAETAGKLATEKGAVRFHTFIHADEPVLLVELEASGAERGSHFVFRPALAIVERTISNKTPLGPDVLNPAPFVEEHGPVHVSVQELSGGAEHAVAWQERGDGGRRLLALSIVATTDGSARKLAAAAVTRAMAEGVARLRQTHRAFWHDYYPASFVSLPDTRLESFYWIQMYKLAAATRADRPAIDTIGPWYHHTGWPRIWWNLNAQLTYWPVYGANRLSLGESLLGVLDRNRETLRRNVPARWREDSMGIGRSSGPDGLSPLADNGKPIEMSNLVWAMHNYWLHWRYGMDATLLRERLYPMLRASVSYLLHRLEPGADGKLHLPEAISPEYPKTVRDGNYDLSLLRWGCETLLALNERLGLEDALAAKWRDTLARLVPFPAGPEGFLIGRDQPYAVSHRHFSHLLMIYPLHLLSPDKPEERAQIERSLAHWTSLPKAFRGFSFVGASAMSSLLGRGDDALKYLDELLDRFVKPNTMYLEGSPVSETPPAGAQAVHEMLLQSWGGTLRVFPAVPAAWREASFQDLRAEGAFLVSAVRAGGATQLVRIVSLAGEPATLQTTIENPRLAGDISGISAAGPGRWHLALRKGQWVELAAPGAPRTIAPVAAQPGRTNRFGLPQ